MPDPNNLSFPSALGPQLLYTATVKLSSKEALTDEGQLLTLLDGTWMSLGQLINAFHSTLWCANADLEVREQHLRIAANLPQLLERGLQAGLISSAPRH